MGLFMPQYLSELGSWVHWTGCSDNPATSLAPFCKGSFRTDEKIVQNTLWLKASGQAYHSHEITCTAVRPDCSPVGLFP